MDTARAPLSWLSGARLGQCGADGRERHDLSPACVSRGPCPRCGVSRGGAAETWPTFPPALAVSGAEAAASPPAGPADVGGALADTAMGSRPCTRGTDPSWPWQPFLVGVPGCPVLAEKLPHLIQERCHSVGSFLSLFFRRSCKFLLILLRLLEFWTGLFQEVFNNKFHFFNGSRVTEVVPLG